MNRPRYSTGRGIARIVFCLACCLPLWMALAPSQVLAADVVINTTVTHDVYGNSDETDGERPSSWDTPGPPPASASGGSVTVNNGGTVDGIAYGGYAESSTGAATASGSVTVNDGGTVDGIAYGGYANSSSSNATASGSITVNSGGTVPNENVYGGYARVVSGTGTATASASGIVTISGGEVGRHVYGGYAFIRHQHGLGRQWQCDHQRRHCGQ